MALKFINFDSILTFDDRQQEFIDINHVGNDITEKDFIDYILNALNFKELKHLIKISICQHTSENDLLSWMKKSDGKYYFNVNINKDDETKKWNDIRNEK